MSVAALERRVDPGQVKSLVLALLVHVLLAVVLVFGVRWQSKPPETVAVELWEPPAAPPPPVAAKPEPRVEPPPPPPVIKPEPAIEKPDIVEKAPPKPKVEPKPVPKPEPKAQPKPPPKPVAKPEPVKKPKPPSDAEAQKRLREELAREQAALAVDRERQEIAERLARESAAAGAKALAGWADKVARHIKSRVRKDVADAVPGNPEAVFLVTLLPSYEVIRITLLKSSGNKAYDEEVQRAIQRGSPLPRPDKGERSERELRLTFRPKDI